MALLDSLKGLIPQNTNIFGARTPTYLEGIVSPEQLKKAEQQSLFQGLLGMGIGYLAQPKNQGYGSAVPYLAKSYLQGMQMAQSPYAGLEKDVLMKEKFDELKRNKAEREAQQAFLSTFGQPNAERIVSNQMAATGAPVQGLEQGSIGPNFAVQPSTVTEQYYDPMKELRAGVAAGVIKPETYLSALSTIEANKLKAQELLNKAPNVEEFYEGNKVVKKQWSPTLGWVKLSEGERFAPKEVKLHDDKITELANGDQVYLPTAEGAKAGVKPMVAGTGALYSGDVKLPKKPLTESQGKNLGYSTRMEVADAQFSNLINPDGTLNYSPASVNSKNVLEGYWGVGDVGAAVLNKFKLSENDKLAAQSMRDFINAILRNESGAAISASEFKNAQRQYFPEVGDADNPKILAQKAQNRQVAITAMKAAAGQDPDAEKKLAELAIQIKTGKTPDSETKPTQTQRAFMGNRAIIVKNNKWVYEDTGESVE